MSAIETTMGEIDPAHFRRVMGRFASGVTVIVAEAEGEVRGMTANAFMSGSLTPPLCIISIAKRARMHAHIQAAGKFSVNILAVGQEDFASNFAGRPNPKLHVEYEHVGGIPTLRGGCAYMTADIAVAHDCGDHTIFIGHVHFMWSDHRPPLVYHAGHYGVVSYTKDIAPSLPEFW